MSDIALEQLTGKDYMRCLIREASLKTILESAALYSPPHVGVCFECPCDPDTDLISCNLYSKNKWDKKRVGRSVNHTCTEYIKYVETLWRRIQYAVLNLHAHVLAVLKHVQVFHCKQYHRDYSSCDSLHSFLSQFFDMRATFFSWLLQDKLFMSQLAYQFWQADLQKKLPGTPDRFPELPSAFGAHFVHCAYRPFYYKDDVGNDKVA